MKYSSYSIFILHLLDIATAKDASFGTWKKVFLDTVIFQLLRIFCTLSTTKAWFGMSKFFAFFILQLLNLYFHIVFRLGMFFSPGLPAINTIKLCLMMYLRSWAVLTCNIPHETVFKVRKILVHSTYFLSLIHFFYFLYFYF